MTMIDGLGFPEALRWRDGALWFSDMFRGRVMRWVPGSPAETVLDVAGGGPTVPGGLGWLPDSAEQDSAELSSAEQGSAELSSAEQRSAEQGSTLLVVDCEQRRVLTIALDATGRALGPVTVHADLAEVMTHSANEMHVDPDGTAWVGGYGFDPERDEPVPSALVRISPDGLVGTTASTFVFPNGCEREIGGALLVAETFADRIMRFAGDTRYHADPALVQRARFAEGSGPDGLSIAPDGSVYVALAFAGALARLAPTDAGPGSEPTIIYRPEPLVTGPGAGPMGVYDCAVHPDGRLIAIGMASLDEDLAARVDTGRILLLSLPEDIRNEEEAPHP